MKDIFIGIMKFLWDFIKAHVILLLFTAGLFLMFLLCLRFVQFIGIEIAVTYAFWIYVKVIVVYIVYQFSKAMIVGNRKKDEVYSKFDQVKFYFYGLLVAGVIAYFLVGADVDIKTSIKFQEKFFVLLPAIMLGIYQGLNSKPYNGK